MLIFLPAPSKDQAGLERQKQRFKAMADSTGLQHLSASIHSASTITHILDGIIFGIIACAIILPTFSWVCWLPRTGLYRSCINTQGPSRDTRCSHCWDDTNGEDATLLHLLCGNSWHKTCLQEWIRHQPRPARCPLCRRNLAEDDVIRFFKIYWQPWKLRRLVKRASRCCCRSPQLSICFPPGDCWSFSAHKVHNSVIGYAYHHSGNPRLHRLQPGDCESLAPSQATGSANQTRSSNILPAGGRCRYCKGRNVHCAMFAHSALSEWGRPWRTWSEHGRLAKFQADALPFCAIGRGGTCWRCCSGFYQGTGPWMESQMVVPMGRRGRRIGLTQLEPSGCYSVRSR